MLYWRRSRILISIARRSGRSTWPRSSSISSTAKVFPREQKRGKTLQKLANDYGVVAGEAAGDDAGLVAVVASGEAAALGAAVSVFCSQAASSAAPAKMQMYFFIGLD